MKRSPSTLMALIAAGALAALSSSAFAATSTKETDPMTGHQYQADYTNRTYLAAHNNCVAIGAELAVITSESEWNFVSTNVISQQPTYTYTIGHKYPANAYNPVTVTGEAYVSLSPVMEFMTQNDASIDYMQYQYIPNPTPHYGLYWEPTISSPYICEWN